MYEQKYLKYKAKYLELKAELEGGISFPSMPSFGKKAPESSEVVALRAKRANVLQKITTLKEQISAQAAKDAAEAKLAAATSSVESANEKAAAEKAARHAAKEAKKNVGATGSAVAMGGVWNPFSKSGPKSQKLLDLEADLATQQSSLKTIDAQIAAQLKADQAKFDLEQATKKQEAINEKAALQKAARNSSAPSTPTADPSAAPAAFWR